MTVFFLLYDIAIPIKILINVNNLLNVNLMHPG